MSNHRRQTAAPNLFLRVPAKVVLILTALTTIAPFPVNAATVDLSTSWAEGSLYNKNKAYCTIQANLAPATTRGYVVIQNGLLVAEGYTGNNNQNGQYDAWSATKSWSTFFIGVLVDQGKLSISETLNDIFNSDSDWNGVGEAADKKTVTVEELLTMTSGLVTGCGQNSNPQSNFQEVMNQVDYVANQRGQFNYLGRTHILAHIIFRRSGLSPRDFANDAGIFSSLGMSDSDFSWEQFGALEGTAFGLKTNPRILAKLGQLYLQGGLSSTTNQLVSQSWVDTSAANQLPSGITNDINPLLTGYGYQWYAATDGGGAYAAAGAFGQTILVLPADNVVVAVSGQSNCGNLMFLEAIVAAVSDLSTEQTTCAESFSYWNYYTQHGAELLWDGLQGLPQRVLGNYQV